MAMEFEAQRCAVWFGMINDPHLIDLPMAARATDAAIHVRGVIVISVIGRPMELHPLHRLSGFPTRPDRLEFRILFLHLGMTGHAGLRVWKIRMRGHIDETMAIATIHPELRDVQIMRERNGLDWLITNPRIFRGDVVPGPRRQTANDDHAADRDFQRQPIRPAWEKIRHSV